MGVISKDVVIIGAGAAGLFCASVAAKRGKSVVVLEKNQQPGRKIIVSGGGRCNFTNLDVRAENFVSENPHFAKSALAGFGSADFIEIVKRQRIAFHEKKLGQLFCTKGSVEILEFLLSDCERAGASVLLDRGVTEIKKRDGFEIKTNRETFHCQSLVIATGGLSFPKLGATGFGYDVAREFGLKIIETRPSLVPLRFKGESHRALAGVSFDARMETGKTSFRDGILFTHHGISGPAVLQISNYWRPETPVVVDFLPDTEIESELHISKSAKRNLRSILSERLPKRFVEEFVPEKLLAKNVADLRKEEIGVLIETINRRTFKFGATEGWDKAEVTAGGVDTKELDSKTMQSRKVEGLYFIGEVVDVTGWLGGYNFQWAWSSAFACGNAV
ncbi:MAG: NAD(P)/FAD-dependent oxidoreductase [Pyrinomonadaceae bacterium]